MILDELGQTFQYGPNQFKIGDIAVSYAGTDLGLCGFIREIDASDATCPTALCDLGCSDSKVLPLQDLTVLAAETPVETGRQYVLLCACDDDEGQHASVLGISESRNVLIHLMLDDLKKRPQVNLSCSYLDKESDSITFGFESYEEELYVSYSIDLVPVYSKTNGGTAE